MQDFSVEIIGPTGDCAVLRIAGELDAYTAPALRDRMRTSPPSASGMSSPTCARSTSSTRPVSAS